MKLCLDTNAYVRLAAGHRPLRAAIELALDVFVPTTVLGELHAGFAMGARREENMQELTRFLSLPGVRITETTAEVAERYGLLMTMLRQAGTPLPTNDIWIAATALELGARLVSYDGHFEKIPGLLVVAP